MKYLEVKNQVNILVHDMINLLHYIMNTEQTSKNIFMCKKSRFIKNQEAKGLLSNLVIKTLLSKVQILGEILF